MPSDAPIAPMEGTDGVAYMIPRYVSSLLWLVYLKMYINSLCF